MTVNYHTHTYRCHHAYGSEWEYVERAISGGLKCLGFSDHAPWPFPGEYRSRVRMRPEQLPAYIEAVEQMKRLYGDRIEIRCGLEAEYYPALFPAFLEMLRQEPGIEYLILGQHFLYNEYDVLLPATRETRDEKVLALYVDQVVEGLETGKFSYLCHPDTLNYQGDPAVYRRHMGRLCRAAKALEIPLELNLQGRRSGFSYPRPDFWAVAGEENCAVLIGTDAHRPQYTFDPREVADVTEAFVRRFGLRLIEIPEIRKEGLL